MSGNRKTCKFIRNYTNLRFDSNLKLDMKRNLVETKFENKTHFISRPYYFSAQLAFI